MSINVEKELAALERLTPKELWQRYAVVYGEPTNAGNKQFSAS